MWIGSVNGWFLLEAQKENLGQIEVKAYRKEELKHLFDSRRISHARDAEGFYVVKVSKQELVDILIMLVKEISYESFAASLGENGEQEKIKSVYQRIMKEMQSLSSD